MGILHYNNALYQIRISIQFASVLQSSGPSEDAGDGVGAGWSPLTRARTESGLGTKNANVPCVLLKNFPHNLHQYKLLMTLITYAEYHKMT